MIRLAEDFCGYSPAKLPRYAYSSELYNDILSRWQDENPDELQALLVKACHRHTYQTYLENEDGYHDWGVPYFHLPIEILMVQRLRQWRGLPEVSVNHILMEAPFDKLPEPADATATDPLVERLMDTFRIDFPDFDAVIAEGMQRPQASETDKKANRELLESAETQPDDRVEQASTTPVVFENTDEVSDGMKRFASLLSGIVFTAPAHWVDSSTLEYFQVIEEQTGTQFTSTVYNNDDQLELKDWAKLRFQAVDERMPYLQFDGEYFSIPGPNWSGYASSYTGTFPDDNKVSKYVVIAFIKHHKMVSFTITADKKVYEENMPFYQQLVTENVDLYEIKKTSLES